MIDVGGDVQVDVVYPHPCIERDGRRHRGIHVARGIVQADRVAGQQLQARLAQQRNDVGQTACRA